MGSGRISRGEGVINCPAVVERQEPPVNCRRSSSSSGSIEPAQTDTEDGEPKGESKERNTESKRECNERSSHQQEPKMVVAEAAKAAKERRRNKTKTGQAGRRPRAKDRKTAQNATVRRHNRAACTMRMFPIPSPRGWFSCSTGGETPTPA